MKKRLWQYLALFALFTLAVVGVFLYVRSTKRCPAPDQATFTPNMDVLFLKSVTVEPVRADIKQFNEYRNASVILSITFDEFLLWEPGEYAYDTFNRAQASAIVAYDDGVVALGTQIFSDGDWVARKDETGNYAGSSGTAFTVYIPAEFVPKTVIVGILSNGECIYNRADLNDEERWERVTSSS